MLAVQLEIGALSDLQVEWLQRIQPDYLLTDAPYSRFAQMHLPLVTATLGAE